MLQKKWGPTIFAGVVLHYIIINTVLLLLLLLLLVYGYSNGKTLRAITIKHMEETQMERVKKGETTPYGGILLKKKEYQAYIDIIDKYEEYLKKQQNKGGNNKCL